MHCFNKINNSIQNVKIIERFWKVLTLCFVGGKGDFLWGWEKNLLFFLFLSRNSPEKRRFLTEIECCKLCDTIEHDTKYKSFNNVNRIVACKHIHRKKEIRLLKVVFVYLHFLPKWSILSALGAMEIGTEDTLSYSSSGRSEIKCSKFQKVWG